ncbi:MAG: MATE family efflux transporter [Lachnospiraceae bacterium]
MKKSFVCDMTKGNEVSLLLRFAVPMLIGNIFQQFYNMVDSIIVGRYVGSNALGAVGAVGNLNFLFFSLCMGLGAGIGILISQYFGAGKEEIVKKCVANSIYITLAAGLLMSVLGAGLAKPILHLMNTPKATFDDAVVYMQIVCGATVVVAGYNTISSILRALGDSKTPLIFLVVSCLINIVLDFWFVLGLNMGVAGAAWATVLAQVVSMVGSIWFGVKTNPYLKLHREHYRVDGDIIKKSFQIGIPIAAQNALIAFSCVALQSVVNRYGETVMAAYTATSRVEQLVQQPFSSLGTAISTFAGQNAGAGKNDRVIKGCKKSVLIVGIFSFVMIGVMFLFSDPIVGIFVTEKEVIHIGAKGLRITSLMYFFLGMIYVMRGALNGVGDAAFAMMNGVTEVVGRIGFAWLLVMIPAIGMWGIWLTNGFTWVLTGLVNTMRFCQGRWKNKTVISTKEIA